MANALLDFLQGASNSAAANVSAPVDGIAWLLRKAGINVDRPVMGSDWMRERGLTAEPTNKLAGILGESVGGVLPMVTAAKAPQIAQGLLQAERNLAAPRTLNPQTGAILWHGSPHKFDAFDSSKIGTGEGAQAYGHGLYLAENPTVAKEYSKLNPAGGQIPSPLRFVNGQEVQPGTGAYKAASLLDSMSVTQARKTVDRWLKEARPEEATYFQDVADTLKAIPSKTAVKQKAQGGALYKVDLPDEHIAKMLDWDKPLSKQSPEVQALLPEKALLNGGNLTGREWYEKINKMPQFSANTSQFLRDKGIPGIRYLDGGSRGAGAGTSNYVVFPGNEGLLSILERNGQPLK